mgnify:FL=1
MKITVIPDIHQDLTTFNKYKDNDGIVICLGDYVDNPNAKEWWNTEDHNPVKVIQTVLEWKKADPEHHIMMLGNRDDSYLGDDCTVKGHQIQYKDEIKEALEAARPYMDIIYSSGNYIFSHAGITEDFKLRLSRKYNADTTESFIKKVNDAFHSGELPFLGHLGIDQSQHKEVDANFLLVKPDNLIIMNAYPEMIQIVGHTEEPEQLWIQYEGKEAGVIVVDSKSHEPIVIDTDTFKMHANNERCIVTDKKVQEAKAFFQQQLETQAAFFF